MKIILLLYNIYSQYFFFTIDMTRSIDTIRRALLLETIEIQVLANNNRYICQIYVKYLNIGIVLIFLKTSTQSKGYLSLRVIWSFLAWNQLEPFDHHRGLFKIFQNLTL